jgi:hypothetical protein
LWQRFYTSDAVFRWPPFLIDLAMEFGRDCDPADLLKDPDFIARAKEACMGRAIKRMPSGFNWETLADFCSSEHANGFDHFVNVETLEQLNRITAGANFDRTGRGFSEEDMKDYRQIIVEALAVFIHKFDPNAGRDGGSSGFEAFLHIYPLNRAAKVLKRLVYTRHLLSLDQAAPGRGDGDGSTMREVLESSCPDRMTTAPPSSPTGEVDPSNLFEIINVAETKVLSESQAAPLYLLSMTGAKSVSEAASFLGIPLQTAYRWLNDVCDRVVEEVQRLVAHSMGMDIDATKREILGYFFGLKKNAKAATETDLNMMLALLG